jgi:hypothetical protein
MRSSVPAQLDLISQVDLSNQTVCLNRLSRTHVMLVQEPHDMKWIYNPGLKLHLTLQQLQLLRRHLFGDSAAALSDRLSDVELVQLLIVSAGQAAQPQCSPVAIARALPCILRWCSSTSWGRTHCRDTPTLNRCRCTRE